MVLYSIRAGRYVHFFFSVSIGFPMRCKMYEYRYIIYICTDSSRLHSAFLWYRQCDSCALVFICTYVWVFKSVCNMAFTCAHRGWGQGSKHLLSSSGLLQASMGMVQDWKTDIQTACAHCYLITILSEQIRSRLWRQELGENSHRHTTLLWSSGEMVRV